MLTGQKQYARAETLLLSSHQGLNNLKLKLEAKWLDITCQHLLTFYQDWGKLTKAAEWQSKADAAEGTKESSKNLKK